MWCAHCQADVATEISGNGQSLNCISCGEQVREVIAPSLHPETKSARELLQKWAEEQKQQLDRKASQRSDATDDAETSQPLADRPELESERPGVPFAEPDEIVAADIQTQAAGQSSTAPSEELESLSTQRPKYRMDAAHENDRAHISRTPQPNSKPKSVEPLASVVIGQGPAQQRSGGGGDSTRSSKSPATSAHAKHAAHEDIPAPHFDVAAASKKAKARPGRVEAIWGQLMAYAGVGILTVGTVLVLWGYFGMIEEFASTGWLLSTAGQMLLLLGIVTLVSGGMQQTTHEVTERIEYLGGRMIRIEQSTELILKGPHFGREKQNSEPVHRERDENSAA